MITVLTRCSHQAKLAARGASVLAASGDYGTAGAPPVEDKCMDKFFPTWPAASPWVSESVPAEYPTSILSTLVSTPVSIHVSTPVSTLLSTPVSAPMSTPEYSRGRASVECPVRTP